MGSTSRGKSKGKEAAVERLLDAQERVFLPERRSAGKAFFDRANSHPRETFVNLQGFGGKVFHVTSVVEDFVTANKPLKDILGGLTYYHDEMPNICKKGKGGKEELVHTIVGNKRLNF